MPSVELVIQTILTALVTVLVTHSTQQLIGYRSESRAWREELSKKVDLINHATQATMRTELIHYAEKYITRGWLTSEEYNAWIDMHEKYSALGANGLIDSYHDRLDALEMHDV